MNTRIDTVIGSALSVATLISDALISPQVAADIVHRPQHVAAVRGLDMQSVHSSARCVETGQKSVSLSFWL